MICLFCGNMQADHDTRDCPWRRRLRETALTLLAAGLALRVTFVLWWGA